MKHHPPEGAVRRARRLRSEMTDAERRLWRMLWESFQDHHFRRQVPIRHFIADFASHRAKLVIEVDGGQHSEAADAARTRVIHQEGYRVLRFWNNEVLGNPDGVWTVIDAALRDRHPTPSPSPSRGGEE
ncbi:MAG: endonuclease domain-containing protein [Bacillota bacterium]